MLVKDLLQNRKCFICGSSINLCISIYNGHYGKEYSIFNKKEVNKSIYTFNVSSYTGYLFNIKNNKFYNCDKISIVSKLTSNTYNQLKQKVYFHSRDFSHIKNYSCCNMYSLNITIDIKKQNSLFAEEVIKDITEYISYKKISIRNDISLYENDEVINYLYQIIDNNRPLYTFNHDEKNPSLDNKNINSIKTFIDPISTAEKVMLLSK